MLQRCTRYVHAPEILRITATEKLKVMHWYFWVKQKNMNRSAEQHTLKLRKKTAWQKSKFTMQNLSLQIPMTKEVEKPEMIAGETVLEINLEAVKHNFHYLKSKIDRKSTRLNSSH